MTAKPNESLTQRPDSFSLALNFLPLAMILCGIFLSAWLSADFINAILCFIAWLYLAPPIVGRVAITIFGNGQGTFSMNEQEYRVWWLLTQLQMVFNRLPWLEEILRLVPGLYPLWISLWGGHVSPFAFIGPGVIITDRHLVRIERGALMGAKAALAGHMALRDDHGNWQIVIAKPIVEREAIMGANSGLGPGAVLMAGAMLPTGRRVAPFASWARGLRKKEEEPS